MLPPAYKLAALYAQGGRDRHEEIRLFVLNQWADAS